MPQTSKISRNNTTIERHPDGSLKWVTLHQTVIFEMGPVREDGSRVLAISNGGWNTVTTQTRLSQCFRESGLPLYYSRAKGAASVHCVGSGKSFPMPPYGRCLMLVVNADGMIEACRDAFVVVNGPDAFERENEFPVEDHEL